MAYYIIEVAAEKILRTTLQDEKPNGISKTFFYLNENFLMISQQTFFSYSLRESANENNKIFIIEVIWSCRICYYRICLSVLETSWYVWRLEDKSLMKLSHVLEIRKRKSRTITDRSERLSNIETTKEKGKDILKMRGL